MGWTDYGWEDDPSTATPLDAEKLEDFGEHVHDAAAATAATALAAHTSDTSAAHAASAISFTPAGTVAATDAQTAIAEVASEAAANLSTGLAGKASSSHTHTVADLGTGTPASGKYLDGAGAWTTLPSAQSGSAPAIVTWDGTGSEPARPSATYVWWFAPSQPAGMVAGDVWTDNS